MISDLNMFADDTAIVAHGSVLTDVIAWYTIHGHALEEVDSAKYLGITLQNKLSWKNHIQQITKKANSTRAFLQRNLYHCLPDTN